MNDARKERFERELQQMLRGEINRMLRVPGSEDVVAVDVNVEVNRVEGAGPEAPVQFDVEVTWTEKERPGR